YWDINAFWIHRPSVLDDRLSRSGPVLRRPGADFWSTNVNTDSRKDVVLSGEAQLGCNRDGDCSPSASLSVKLRPASNVTPALGVRDSIFIDPDGSGPAARFAIEDPSFTLRSLRGNAVLRWEYRPGSTLYLVWTRNGASSLTRGVVDFGADARALFRGPSEN